MTYLLSIAKESPRSAELLEQSSMNLQSWWDWRLLEQWIVDHPEIIDPTLMIVTSRVGHGSTRAEPTRNGVSLLALADSGELVLLRLVLGQVEANTLLNLFETSRRSHHTRGSIAETHADWLRLRGNSDVDSTAAARLLTGHVQGRWTDDLLESPRIVVVAEKFPEAAIEAIGASAAPRTAPIDVHEYVLFDQGESVAVAIRHLFSSEGSKTADSDAASLARRTHLATNRRIAQVIETIHQAGALHDTARLDLDLAPHVGAEVADRVAAWLDAEPKRRDVRWRSHRSRPLVWAGADDPQARWTPTALRDEIFARSIGEHADFIAAEAWKHRGRSLAEIADNRRP